MAFLFSAMFHSILGQLRTVEASTVALHSQTPAYEQSHLQGLFVIEPWIDRGFVGSLQVIRSEAARASDTLGHIFAREFEVYASEHAAQALVDVECLLELA